MKHIKLKQAESATSQNNDIIINIKIIVSEEVVENIFEILSSVIEENDIKTEYISKKVKVRKVL